MERLFESKNNSKFKKQFGVIIRNFKIVLFKIQVYKVPVYKILVSKFWVSNFRFQNSGILLF